MTKRLIMTACGTALLIAAAIVVALRERQQPAPLPEVPVAVPTAEERVKAVERKAEPVKRGEVASASDAVAIVCGADERGWKALDLKPDLSGADAICDGRIDKFFTLTGVPSQIEFELSSESTLRAFRLIWRDIGLDLARGVKQGPYKYRIDFLSGDGWKTLADASGNETDLFIDYRETMPATTSRLRLCVLDAPPGITPAIAEFTVFGE